MLATNPDILTVNSVVVNLAKAPLKAAQQPLPTAQTIQADDGSFDSSHLDFGVNFEVSFVVVQ